MWIKSSADHWTLGLNCQTWTQSGRKQALRKEFQWLGCEEWGIVSSFQMLKLLHCGAVAKYPREENGAIFKQGKSGL